MPFDCTHPNIKTVTSSTTIQCITFNMETTSKPAIGAPAQLAENNLANEDVTNVTTAQPSRAAAPSTDFIGAEQSNHGGEGPEQQERPFEDEVTTVNAVVPTVQEASDEPPEPPPEEKDNAKALGMANFVMMDVDSIILNPLSDKVYGTDVSASLLASIGEIGVKDPVQVEPKTKMVVVGGSRVRASRMLGIKQIPGFYLDAGLSENQLANLVMESNIARVKTPEMQVREFEQYLLLEKPLAALRKASKTINNEGDQKVACGKSRDKAAAKVGPSASSLEDGLKVLKAMKDLKDSNLEAEAEELRQALNARGFSPALNLAISKGWYDTGKPIKKKPILGDPKIRRETVEDADRVDKVAAKVETPQAEVPPIVDFTKDSDKSTTLAEEGLNAAEGLLKDLQELELSQEENDRIIKALQGVNDAAVLVGITIGSV